MTWRIRRRGPSEPRWGEIHVKLWNERPNGKSPFWYHAIYICGLTIEVERDV